MILTEYLHAHTNGVCVRTTNRSYGMRLYAFHSVSETKIISQTVKTKFSPSLNFVLDSSLALVALFLTLVDSPTQQTHHSGCE